MKQEAVLEVIGKLNGGTMRPVVHGKSTKLLVSDEGKVAFRRSGGNVIDVEPTPVDALLKSVGIGTELARGVTPDTLGRVGTDLLAKKERYNLVLDGKTGQVVDIVTPKGSMVEPERLVTTVERVLPGADFHRVYEVQPHVMRLEIMAFETTSPIVYPPGTHGKVNDLIRAGTVVMFSPFGVSAPVVEAFTVRQWCTNGATSEDVLRAYTGHGGEGDNIWQWFRRSIKEASGAVKGIADKYSTMLQQDIPADQRGAVLEAMLKEAKFSEEAAAAIRDHALQEPPQNQFDMLNLITWGTSHLRIPGVEIARGQRAAGRFLDHPERIQAICVACHQPVGRGHAHAALAAPAA